MALVTRLEPLELNRETVHEEVAAARYATFKVNGRTLVQINTYGKLGRKNPENVSQSIQLDREGAEALVGILREAFDL